MFALLFCLLKVVYLDMCVNLTHRGQVMHIGVSKLTIIGSDNGLSPGWRQVIISTNTGLFLIGTLGTHFSEILGEIHTFSFKKMHLKMLSAKWWQICLHLNMLTGCYIDLDDFIHSRKCVWNCHAQNVSHFLQAMFKTQSKMSVLLAWTSNHHYKIKKNI